MVNGPFTYTPSGKKRAPSKELVLQWIQKAWQEIPADLIVNSFKCCGISNALDGTEDEAVWDEEEAGEEEADDELENEFVFVTLCIPRYSHSTREDLWFSYLFVFCGYRIRLNSFG